jgi:spore germination cell wall hydrolase CwlJ-like protein
MIDVKLDEGQHTEIQVPKLLSTVVTICLMIVALSISVGLLKWVMADKLTKFEDNYGSQLTAEVRERQLQCLARNIYYEAGNEPFEGKVAVAQVTINRVESGQFPNDVCKTVYQKNVFYEKVVCQFSWYCDRAAVVRPIHKSNFEESMVAAKKVLLEGFRLPSLENALYYHADYVNPGWRKEKVAKIGRHIFYN